MNSDIISSNDEHAGDAVTVNTELKEDNAPFYQGEVRNPLVDAHTSEPAASPALSPEPPKQSNDKKSKRSCGCWAIAVLVCLMFLGGLGALIYLACSDLDTTDHSVSHKRTPLSYHLLGYTHETDVKSKIVVLPVDGTISSARADGVGDFCTPDSLEEALDFIAQDEDVAALILRVNSPGGGLTASDVMYHHLKRFKKATGLPIYAFFEDSACSGGYYISMAADTIYACPTTMTGSIGVIMTLPEISGLMNKAGVKVNAITSRNFEGKESYKDIGSMFRAMKPQEREILQNLITDSWQRFVQVVADGRKGKLTKDQVKRLADGRIFSANQAKKERIIDEVCYADELYDKLMKELSQKGKEKPRAVLLKRNSSLMDNFSILGVRSWLLPLGTGVDMPQTAAPSRYLLSPVSGQLQ